MNRTINNNGKLFKGIADKLIKNLKHIYNKIPIPILNSIGRLFWLIPPRIRFGHTFIETWEMLERHEFHTKEEFDELVNENFISLVKTCSTIPHYKDVMEKNRIDPNEITGIEDLKKFPIIDKEIIRKEQKNLISMQVEKENIVIKHTSGSTGLPLDIYFDNATTMREWANVLHLWKRVGYKWESSRLVLRDVRFKALEKGVPYQWDSLRRELSINVHNMSDSNCFIYCKQIERRKPEFIYGYPSVVFQLCEYIELHPIQHHFKAALLISETVTDTIRTYIEKVLNLRVYSFYGQTERVAIAGECEEYSHYHVEPTYGYVEIIDENGELIEDDRVGELVVTGFTNKIMPFIRYRTGDLGCWDTQTKCKCGRYHKVIKYINGRTADYLLDKHGGKISINAFRTNSIGLYNILEYQFEQNELGIVVLKLITNSKYSIYDEQELLKLLSEDADFNIEFKLQKCSAIPCGANGKTRQVIQNIVI